MADLSLQLLALLALAAFVAGFIDAIAGGGGLITVPALLIAGFGPVQAIATNKLQGMFGSASATISYASKGQVDPVAHLGWVAMSAGGGLAGALLVAWLPGDLMRAILPLLLVAIALFFLLKPGMGQIERARRMSPTAFGLTLVPAIAVYDGMFGPGTGSFFMLALVTLSGFGLLKATAHTKLLNLASNVGAFAVFAFVGAIAWKVGLVMGLAQFAGARLGAGLAMKTGARLIRPLLVIVCLALAAKLLLDPTNPLRQALTL